VARPVATPPSKSTSALAPRSAERCTAVRECLKTRCRAYGSKIKKILAGHNILKPRTFLQSRTLPRTALKNQDCPANPGRMVRVTIQYTDTLLSSLHCHCLVAVFQWQTFPSSGFLNCPQPQRRTSHNKCTAVLCKHSCLRSRYLATAVV
jgi:hypothetical protein